MASKKSGGGCGRGKRKRASDGGWGQFGGYMNAKIMKLQDQFSENRQKQQEKDGVSSNIFQGVSIFVNGYTDPNSAELKRLMMVHGGIYRHYYNRTGVTHIIASNLPDSKIKDIKDKKVIKPEWIVDSIKAGKLLPYQNYEVYSSRSRGQQGLFRFSEADVSTRVSTRSSQKLKETIAKREESHIQDSSCVKDVTLKTKKGVTGNNDVTVCDRNTEDRVVVDLTTETDLPCEMSTVDVNSNSEKTLKNNSEKSEMQKYKFSFSNSEKPLKNYSNKSEMQKYKFSFSKTDDTGNCARTFTGRSKAQSAKTENNSDNSLCPNIVNLDQNKSVETRTGPAEIPRKERTDLKNSEKSPKMENVSKTCDTSKHGATTSRSAKDPNFLAEFYANSRLHYISTWGAECKQYVNKLQTECTGNFPGKDKLSTFVRERRTSDVLDDSGEFETVALGKKPRRTIMHVDMDCFFVSVGLQKRPELRGKPVAVTHSKGKGESISASERGDREKEWAMWKKKKLERQKKRHPGASAPVDDMGDFEDDDVMVDEQGPQPTETSAKKDVYSMAEIASCSYEARKAGVKNGMFVGNALKLCPDLIPIPYDFEAYKATSQKLYDIVASYTHDIEAVSCDEMFVDCTELLTLTGAQPEEFASLVREEIREKTGCNASAGLGSNILFARLATRVAKPNGQYCLPAEDEHTFISKQVVKDLPGVGWSTCHRLEALKVKTCGDLQTIPLTTLQQEFGPKTGASLYKYCRGQDDRPIKMEKERKSVSAEVNYGIRFTEDKDMVKFINNLTQEVEKRLNAVCVKGRSITLKLKVRSKDAPVETSKFMGHGVCDNCSKSVTLPIATNNPDVIATECMSLYRALKVPVTDLRGIGIQMHRLETTVGKNEKPSKNTLLSFMAPKPNKTTDTTKGSPNGKHVSTPSKAGQSTDPEAKPTHFKTPTSKPASSNCDLTPSRFNTPTSKVGLSSDSGPAASTPHEKGRVVELDGGACGSDFGRTDSARNLSVEEYIQKEIKRKELASSGLPPLPTLSPIQSCSTPRDVTPAKPSSDPTSYFPSPSQIDPAVLRELPKEIQDQIKSEMQTYKKSKEPVKDTGGGSQEAGCSHWEKDKNNRPSSSPIVELPSFSQVDRSCFDALPNEIRAELEGAYAAEKNKKKTVQLSWKLGAEKSPVKKKSPQKKSPSPKKVSPKFKVPQGRAVSRKKAQAKRLDFTTADDDPDVIEILPIPPAPDLQVPEVAEVNLCGAVELPDVKALLTEWIHSSPTPELEDTERFLHYLQNLAKDKNLERIDLLLKYLKRTLQKLNSPGWDRALKELVTELQKCVIDIYGCELRVNT